MDRATAGEPIRIVCHAPPDMWKSETVSHWLARTLLIHPDWPIAYVCHTDKLAQDKSGVALRIVRQLGVELARDRADSWRTVQGGGIDAFGWRAAIAGFHYRIMVFDDLVKNRSDAESAVMRRALENEYSDVLEPRLHPQGSAIHLGTRWTMHDLPSKLISKGSSLTLNKPWPYLCLKALSDDGVPLLPTRYTKEHLEAIRAENLYRWLSLYQGTPKARGGSVFEKDPVFYSNLPETFRVSHGVDLAYSSKKTACWSVCVTMLAGDDGFFYIPQVQREQVKPREFRKTLRAVAHDWPGSTMRIYAAGRDIEEVELMTDQNPLDESDHGIPLDAMQPKGDKYVRAQPFATAWNDGRVLVPGGGADWLDPFLEVVLNFTGSGDEPSDDVDAGSAAYDQLVENGPMPLLPKKLSEMARIAKLDEALPFGGRQAERPGSEFAKLFKGDM